MTTAGFSEKRGTQDAMSNETAKATLRSVAPGLLKLGTLEIECHVLSDGRRVLSTKQTVVALGYVAGNRDLGRALGRIPSASGSLNMPPGISFRTSAGNARGYEASALVDICVAYQEALVRGLITNEGQRRVAVQATMILGAVAKVGIDALIDEATGYQQIRANDALAQQLRRYLREDAAKWVQVFSEDLDYATCRLRNKPLKRNPVWKRGDIGRIYNIIHGKEVMRALRGRNPRPRFSSNHHQFFTELVQRGMRNDLEVVLMFAKTSRSVEHFYETLRTHFRGMPLQLDLLR